MMNTLWKSIVFHYKMMKNYFTVSFYLVVIFVFLYITYASALGIVLAVGVVICFFLGLEKIFGKSLFGDEGNLYMVLPMSVQDLIWGRTLTVGLWLLALQVLLFLTMLIYLLMAFQISTLIAGVEDLFFQFIENGMQPWEIGFIIGMMPIRTMLSGMLLGEVILACELLIHSRRNKALKKSYSWLGVILGMILFILFTWTVFFWADLLIAGHVIQIVVMYLLYRFCRNQFQSNFDLI